MKDYIPAYEVLCPQAVELRKQGKTHQQISDELGIKMGVLGIMLRRELGKKEGPRRGKAQCKREEIKVKSRKYNFRIEDFRELKEAAVRAVFKYFYNGLCYFAFKFIGEPDDAEDIVQEAFAKLLNKKGDFDSIYGIRSFLYRAVRNGCIDYLRALSRHDVCHKEIGLTEAVDSEELEVTSRVLQLLAAQIEKLPPQCAIIMKGYFKGKETDEIAHQLNIENRTVLNQKTRGIGLLKEWFQRLQETNDVYLSIS